MPSSSFADHPLQLADHSASHLPWRKAYDVNSHGIGNLPIIRIHIFKKDKQIMDLCPNPKVLSELPMGMHSRM